MKLSSIHCPQRTVWLERKVDARDALAVAFEYIEKSDLDDATMQHDDFVHLSIIEGTT